MNTQPQVLFVAAARKILSLFPKEYQFFISRKINLSKLSILQNFYRYRIGADRPLVNRISLVVATYNVEPYLDEFLRSATYQSCGTRNLEIILVDDGSTDRSGEIAESWVRRFPDTIRYFRKENGGVSSARNFGLDHATGDWVSFPDPDDILSARYLHLVDRELEQHHERPLAMVSCRAVILDEARTIRDNHPLTYKFTSSRTVRPVSGLGSFVQLFANSSFFKRSRLEGHGLRFDPRVRPAGEDGHLIQHFLLRELQGEAVFLREPTYLYRKRAAKNSIVDRAKADPAWHDDQLRHGPLDVLLFAEQSFDRIPLFVQNYALYDIMWRLRWIVDQPQRAALLTDRGRQTLVDLLKRVFEFVDADAIETFRSPLLSHEHRVALLHRYKGSSPKTPIARLRQINASGEMQFEVHAGARDVAIEVEVDDRPTPLSHPSRSVATFLDEEFFHTHRFWLPAPSEGCLRIRVDGNLASIKYQSRDFGAEFTHHDVNALRQKTGANAEKGAGSWILMDRHDRADDNAEHLYRYVRQRDPKRIIWYVLDRTSRDWQRLKRDGFRLLAYGSRQHRAELRATTLLISSHVDKRILFPFPGIRYGITGPKFIFLHHGVPKDDQSVTLNAKPISLKIAATAADFDAVTSIDSNYLLSSKEVVLTGLPRHDALPAIARARRTLLIMPTWRKYLASRDGPEGARAGKIEGFRKSSYALNWTSLVNSESLREMADRAGLAVVFSPHPLMSEYAHDFRAPAWVEVQPSYELDTVQALFADAALLVTDFSSVAFDVAYLDRPVVYYHFDMDGALSGKHSYTRGFFDYENDGFGPVCETEDAVLDAIKTALSGHERPEYARRRAGAFTFRDGRNSERVYDAILEFAGHRREASVTDTRS